MSADHIETYPCSIEDVQASLERNSTIDSWLSGIERHTTRILIYQEVEEVHKWIDWFNLAHNDYRIAKATHQWDPELCPLIQQALDGFDHLDSRCRAVLQMNEERKRRREERNRRGLRHR